MSEFAIRQRLRAHLAAPGRLLVDEVGILQGLVRADVVAVDELIHGYEIKAAGDSLARLARQIDGYGRVFDRASAVVAPAHLRGVLAALPAWWGVLAVDDTLRVEREAMPHEPETRALAELLWTEDTIALLEQRGAARGMRGKARRLLWDRLCEVYSPAEIHAAVREVLRERHSGPTRKTRPPMLRP